MAVTIKDVGTYNRLPVEVIQKSQNYLDEYASDLSCDMTIYVDNHKKEQPVLRAFIRYVHECNVSGHVKAEKQEIASAALLDDLNVGMFTVYMSLEKTIEKYRRQLNCVHTFIRPKDEHGEEYPDGRAICSGCDVFFTDILPKIPGKVAISKSFGQDVVSQFDWPCSVQGGDRGVVISKKGNYKTAFFEAFPNVGEFGTFIRGEGASLKEAEIKCWEKYQKQLSCKEHVWSRGEGDKIRTNGWATCELCGLFAEALPPLTTCQICEKPTTKTGPGGYFCLTHYYETDDSVLVTHHLERMRGDSLLSVFVDDSDETIMFDFLFEHWIERLLLSHLTEPVYLKHESKIERFIHEVRHLFVRRVLGISMGDEETENLPAMDDVRVSDFFSRMKDHFIHFAQQIVDEGSYSSAILAGIVSTGTGCSETNVDGA